MTEIEDRRVALWWWSHGSLQVTVYDSEETAAMAAHDFFDYDDSPGAPAGVQFPDGRYLAANRNDWPAYAAEDERRWKAVRESFDKDRAKPKPVTRRISPPFDSDATALVEGDIPDWVGRSDLGERQ